MGFFKSIFSWIAGRPPYSTPATPQSWNTPDQRHFREIVESVNLLHNRLVDLDRRVAQLESGARTATTSMDMGARFVRQPIAQTLWSESARPTSHFRPTVIPYLKRFGEESRKLVNCLTDSHKDGEKVIELQVNSKISEFEAKLEALDRQYPGGSPEHQKLDQSVRKEVLFRELTLHFLELAETDLKSSKGEQKDTLEKAIENFAAFLKLKIIKPVQGDDFDSNLHEVVGVESGSKSMKDKICVIHGWGYKRESSGECIKKAKVSKWD